MKFKPWSRQSLPKKVLFIRLQAMGDVIIALPYIKGFKKAYPSIETHLITRKEDGKVPGFIGEIDKVWQLGGGRNPKLQLWALVRLLPNIITEQYDIIYDLQGNKISRAIRMLIPHTAYTTFDKYSSKPAGHRVLDSIKLVGLSGFEPDFSIRPHYKVLGKEILSRYAVKKFLILINPAGFFKSRNWPFEYYLEWARLMCIHFDGDVTFLWVGVGRIQEKAEAFQAQFPDYTLNLVNQTTQLEAFSLVQCADFMLTEDSGLMHMAWTTGIKTLAIFGSTRSDWSRPQGSHSKLFSSEDLACGNCMLPICKYGDNRCLTRYSPAFIFEETIKLMDAYE